MGRMNTIAQPLWPAGRSQQQDNVEHQAPGVETTSEQLMLDFAQGNAKAFDVLYERHRESLYRFVYRHVGRRAQAEEIYQDTWVKVLNARHRYQPKARFQTWLYRIAHHRIIDWYRKSRPVTLAEPDQVPAQPVTDSATTEQIAKAINAALINLPLDQRSTVLLHLEKNMTLSEIAEICGCGRETVKSRMRYASAKLRDALGGFYGEL